MGLTDFKARLGAEEFRILLRLQRSFTNRNKLDIIDRLHAQNKMSDDEYAESLKSLLSLEGGI